ncbi:MAG TPA: class I SAM-dependent methyltransferase [Thermoanaerobaculia bacterium]|nr:class I SAM-dependent methyltransferase [Thermoanaerobaculia bacterium]
MNVIRTSDEVLPFPSVSDRPVTALRGAVEDFCSLDAAPPAGDDVLHHAVMTRVHAICSRVLDCEAAGMSRTEIVEVLAPVRAIHARSPFVRRLQEWPRGYPGDFETVEYICDSENRAPRGTVEYHCESYSLNLPIAQQHRNKVRHQAARIMRTLFARPAASRVLALACGSCPDFELIQPHLASLAGEIYLNDSDPAAIAFAESTFDSVASRCRFVLGNALKVARKMEQIGSFDLVIAGGLFDYLPEKHAVYLIENVYRGLLAPGGTFFFTNIAHGNPWRSLIEYLGDWFLIERTEEDIRALCEAASVPREAVSIRRDETGLALLIEVTRS